LKKYKRAGVGLKEHSSKDEWVWGGSKTIQVHLPDG